MGTEMWWMTAKHGGECADCGSDIEEGDRIVWVPSDNDAFCSNCGPDIIGNPDPSKSVLGVLRLHEGKGGEKCPDCYHQKFEHKDHGRGCQRCGCLRQYT